MFGFNRDTLVEMSKLGFRKIIKRIKFLSVSFIQGGYPFTNSGRKRGGCLNFPQDRTSTVD